MTNIMARFARGIISGEGFEFCQKAGYYHYSYFLESESQGCIIDRRPDRHFLTWFRPDRQLGEGLPTTFFWSRKIKLIFLKKGLKKMLYRIKMVARSAKQMQSNDYTVLIEENYYDTKEEHTYPKIYLTFPSIKDFNKLNDIEQMMETLYNPMEKSIREN